MITGGRQGVGLRTQLILPQSDAPQGLISQQLRALRLTRHQLEAEQLSLSKRREQLSLLSLQPRVRNLRRVKASPLELVADLVQGNRFIQEKLAALDAQLSQLAQRLEASAKELEVAQVEAKQSSSQELHGEQLPRRLAVLRVIGAGELLAVSLVYTVAAARWWPAYTARLSANATKASLSLEAFIAQASGEDWSGVSLSLCTADLIADARLPELPSLRLGRSQPKTRRGFREPPQGLDELFRSYEQTLPTNSGGALTVREEPKPRIGLSARSTTTESEDASELFSLALASREKTIVPERAAELPTDVLYERAKKQREQAATLTLSNTLDAELLPQTSRASGVGSLVGGLVGGIMGGVAAAFGGSKADEGRGEGLARTMESPEAELPEGWLDFDTLTLSAASGSRRGNLTRIIEPSSSSNASDELEQLPAPYLTRDPKESRGQFDHRYAAQGQCEIFSSGKAQRVHLLTAESPASPVLRAVPREASDVYREASVKNPFDAPLLSGPIDVFIDGALLTTTTLSAVDRGGYLSLGLGVEERIRISRNARVEESSTGLLSGKTHIDHHISIEVASALGYPTHLEVIDRIPVSDDKAAEIVLGNVVPASQWYDQVEKGKPIRGGILWDLELPPAGKTKIEFSYRINFPAKNEVVGGNRREG
jgi:hypothetical protein